MHNGKNWKKIAEHLPGREDTQCLHRWQKVLNPELVKGPWTQEVCTNKACLLPFFRGRRGVYPTSLCRLYLYVHVNTDMKDSYSVIF